MLPVIEVQRPRGVLPAAEVRRRTVVDVQPGLLLLLTVVGGGLLLWRRRSRKVLPAYSPPSLRLQPVTTDAEVEGIRRAAAEAQDRPLP